MKVIFKTTDGAVNIADMIKINDTELIVENLEMTNVCESLKIPNLDGTEDPYTGKVIFNRQHIIWYVYKE